MAMGLILGPFGARPVEAILRTHPARATDPSTRTRQQVFLDPRELPLARDALDHVKLQQVIFDAAIGGAAIVDSPMWRRRPGLR